MSVGIALFVWRFWIGYPPDDQRKYHEEQQPESHLPHRKVRGVFSDEETGNDTAEPKNDLSNNSQHVGACPVMRFCLSQFYRAFVEML